MNHHPFVGELRFGFLRAIVAFFFGAAVIQFLDYVMVMSDQDIFVVFLVVSLSAVIILSWPARTVERGF